MAKRRAKAPPGPRVFTAGREDRVLAIAPNAVGQAYEKADTATEQMGGADVVGTIGVVNIEGPLSYKAGWWFDNYQSIRERFDEALATSDLVVLRICSPGGEASGCFETARAMRAAADAAGKPVIAFSDESCYSAAYALACAADEIYLPESGGVGSVGVLCVVGDWTEMTKRAGLNIQVIRSGARKADGHPDIPLTKDVIARFQTRVDTLADQFADLVGESRELTPAKVLSYQGDVFYGGDAVSAGLADGVMSWDALVGALTSRVADAVTKASADRSTDRKALDNQAPSRSEGGSEHTHVDPRESPMTITQLYAALKAAQAAGDAAETKRLQAEIDTRLAAGERAEEDADDEDADDDEAEDSDADDDEAEDDGEDDDDSEDDDEDAEDEKTDPKGKAVVPSAPPKVAKSTGRMSAQKLLTELFPNMSAAKIRGKLMALQASQEVAKKNEARMAKLEQEQKASKVAALVKRGMREGKITPAQKAFWTETGMRSTATLREFLKSAPVVANTDPHRAPDAPGAAAATGIEQEVLHKLGVDPVEYSKHKTAAARGATFSPSYAENAPRARVQTYNERHDRNIH